MLPLLHQFRREGQAAQERAEEPLHSRLSRDFRSGWRMGTILRGWALTEQGQGEEGIAQMRQGLAACRATGAELSGRIFLPYWPRRMGKWGKQKKG